MISVVVNTVLCMAIFWTCFCRVVRTNGETLADVRLAFTTLAIVSLLCTVAPFWWGTCVSWPHLAFEVAVLTLQGLTARHWKDGVPRHFQRAVCPVAIQER